MTDADKINLDNIIARLLEGFVYINNLLFPSKKCVSKMEAAAQWKTDYIFTTPPKIYRTIQM